MFTNIWTKSNETILERCIYMLHQIVNAGKTLIWSHLLSQQLRINVKNGNNPPKGKEAIIYVSGHLLDGICA